LPPSSTSSSGAPQPESTPTLGRTPARGACFAAGVRGARTSLFPWPVTLVSPRCAIFVAGPRFSHELLPSGSSGSRYAAPSEQFAVDGVGGREQSCPTSIREPVSNPRAGTTRRARPGTSRDRSRDRLRIVCDRTGERASFHHFPAEPQRWSRRRDSRRPSLRAAAGPKALVQRREHDGSCGLHERDDLVPREVGRASRRPSGRAPNSPARRSARSRSSGRSAADERERLEEARHGSCAASWRAG